jgi:hypothetical protein
MPEYDRSFDPPAPIAGVTILHPVTGARSTDLRGKMDTGADFTVIPERWVLPLRLKPRGEAWTRGFDGTYSRRRLYYVRLVVEEFDLPIIRCVASDRTNVLLGRNVLLDFRQKGGQSR